MIYEIFIMVLFVLSLGYLEFQIDRLFWKSGKSDKPWSTILRGIVILGTSLTVSGTYGVHWWQTAIFLSTLYFLLFDFELNLLRGKHIFHTGTGNWYEKARKAAGPFIEIFVKLIIASAGYGVYARLDWIV